MITLNDHSLQVYNDRRPALGIRGNELTLDLRRQQTGSRLLATDLAVRLFEEDHGRLPTTLDELAPEYLPGVPTDPFSGKPLIYRVQEEGFLLYSVGRDGIDNGGKPRRISEPLSAPDIDWTPDPET